MICRSYCELCSAGGACFKGTAINGAREQNECPCTAEISAEAPGALVWTCSYFYSFGPLCFTVLVLQTIVPNDLVKNILTELANFISLYDSTIQYISSYYVLSCDET